MLFTSSNTIFPPFKREMSPEGTKHKTKAIAISGEAMHLHR